MIEKEKLLKFCATFIDDRITRIQKNISEIQESLTSETKSSAGDKHETGRAMLQLEREKLGQQLLEAEKTKQTLSKVAQRAKAETIGLGSLVYTEKANYFLAISAGEFKEANTSIYCISADTPIGKLLLGKKEKEVFVFNTVSTKIKEII